MAPHLPSLLFFSLTLSLLTPTILSCQLCNSSQPSPLFTASQSSSTKDDNIIKSLCANTTDPNLCISTIQCQLPVQNPLDSITVLKLLIRAVRSNSKAAKSAASELLHDPKNKKAIQPLKDCKELYGNMVDSLDSADVAIEARDNRTVGSKLSAIRTDVSTCKDGFDETGSMDLMAKCDDLLVKLSSICLAIAHGTSLM